MLENYLIRGMLIGLVLGVPAGAIGALSVQRALSHGFRAGFFTGLGSSAADLVYAGVGIFGITIVSDFLLKHQAVIGILGSILIVILGIGIFRKKSVPVTVSSYSTQVSRFFGASFGIALANPATIMAFFIAFSSFGIGGKLSPTHGLQLIMGILLGTSCWWGILSGTVCVFRSHITERIYKRLNQILGIFMLLFGVAMLARTFL